VSGGEAGRYAGLGLQFALTIGLFAFAGYWLDGRLGSSPLLLLVGIFLGATAGFVYLVKTIGGGSDGRRDRRDARR
jgi:F0F1-type ATP synthase assembly protein I